MKISSPETLWGLIKLYFSLSLFALPLGYALDLKWEHLMEGKFQPHIIGITIALGLTARQLLQIGRDYTNLHQEKGDTLPQKPHGNDQPFDDYLLDLFNSPFFEYKFLENEQMTEFVKRTVHADTWIVPEKLDLTRKHRQGLAKRILLTYERFASSMNILHLQTQRLEKIVSDWTNPFDDIFGEKPQNPTQAKEMLEGFRKSNNDKDRQLGTQSIELTRLQKLLQKWQSLALMFPGTSDDFTDVKKRITTSLDLTPLINLLQEDSRPPAPTPAKLATSIDAALEGLRTDIAAIAGKTPPPTQDIQETIRWVSRQVKGISAMSGVTPTLPSLTLAAIWDALPDTVTEGYTEIPDEKEMEKLLSRLDLAIKGKSPATKINCAHPEDLSTILTGNTRQEWPDSLQQVQDLLDFSHAPSTSATRTTPDEERLFSSNDAPKLTDEDDYWTYRRSFEIFASASTVTPRQLPIAISRLLNRYEGKRRAYMMAYDVGANLKATWTPTWKAILKYMDARFLDRDAHLELFKKWITLRHSATFWGQEFIAEFDRIRMTLNQIAPLQDKTQITDDKAFERLMDKIPKRVRDAFRYNHPKAEFQLLDETNDTTLGDVYDWIINDWKYLHATGQLTTTDKNKDKPSSKSSTSVSETHPGNQLNWADLVCDKPCFDTSPAIHPSLRGSWRELKPDQKLGLHAKCRRPIEEHNHSIIGCSQPGNHIRHLTTSKSSAPPPSGNDSGDQ